MRRFWAVLAVLIGLVTGITSRTWTGAVEPQPAHRLFSGLTIGQPVNLKDAGAAYEIGTLDDRFPMGHEIVEIGADYLVVRDVTGAVETSIPVTSIKAITRLTIIR